MLRKEQEEQRRKEEIKQEQAEIGRLLDQGKNISEILEKYRKLNQHIVEYYQQKEK